MNIQKNNFLGYQNYLNNSKNPEEIRRLLKYSIPSREESANLLRNYIVNDSDSIDEKLIFVSIIGLILDNPNVNASDIFREYNNNKKICYFPNMHYNQKLSIQQNFNNPEKLAIQQNFRSAEELILKALDKLYQNKETASELTKKYYIAILKILEDDKLKAVSGKLETCCNIL